MHAVNTVHKYRDCLVYFLYVTLASHLNSLQWRHKHMCMSQSPQDKMVSFRFCTQKDFCKDVGLIYEC